MRHPPARILALAVLLAAGCGEESEAPAAAPRAGDPTLRGLVAYLAGQGLAVGEPTALAADADQKAKLGRAVGLANELAGAGIATDLPTETSVRTIDGVTVVLQRYPDPTRARAGAAKQRRDEAAHADAGKIVILEAGDMVAAVRGPGGAASSFERMSGVAPRPAGPPPPELVGKLGAALEAFHRPAP